MAPAPKKKVEEPSSEYYSETPPEAGWEEAAAAAEPAKERPAEPEADYGGGTDEEPSVVFQPKEAKEAKAKGPEPKQRLAEPEVKKKPKAPEEADRRKRERSPKSGQSSNRSWEKVPSSGWAGRPGHPMEKNGLWGPFGQVKPFRISELPAFPDKGAGSGGSGGKDERVSCPVCWSVKPRNTLWLHLSNSASCGSWQEKLLGLSDGTKQEKCRFCSKAFYRESDRLQHERNCTAQPVAEPASPPRRKVEKESTSKREALRMDSRERMMEKDRGRYESRGRSRRNRRASSAPEPVRLRSRERSRHQSKRRARSPRSPSPTPGAKGSGSGFDETLPGLYPKAAMPEPAPAPAAVKEEPAETCAAEPASGSGTGAQASTQDRKLSAYERLLALGRRFCEPVSLKSLPQLFEAGLASGKGFPLKSPKSF